MPTEEFERVKEVLKGPPTPEAMKKAAEAFREYSQVVQAKGRKSKPMLVSLGLKKTYPTAIPLEKIPEELEKNPEFFKLLGRIIKERS